MRSDNVLIAAAPGGKAWGIRPRGDVDLVAAASVVGGRGRRDEGGDIALVLGLVGLMLVVRRGSVVVHVGRGVGWDLVAGVAVSSA